MPKFDTPEPITAAIDGVGGRLRILASDRADTVVDVQPGNESSDADRQAAQQTQVEFAGGRLLVKGPKSKFRSLFGRTPSVDLTIELPSDSRVDAKGWGEMRAEGRLGDCAFDTAAGAVRLDQTARLKVRSAAGDIWVGRATGSVEASTASGKIWFGDIDGAAVVKTSLGDITVGEVTGDARLNTAYGDLAVDRAAGGVSAKTAYGAIRVGEVVRGSVVLETGFGEVEVGIATGTAAWLDVSSQAGNVRSELDSVDTPAKSDETAEVRARTKFGDILIRRS